MSGGIGSGVRLGWGEWGALGLYGGHWGCMGGTGAVLETLDGAAGGGCGVEAQPR